MHASAVRHEFVEANGTWLHHLDFGGSGRPVLLLHGVTGSAWDWHDVAAGLGSASAAVALDLRGHGDSLWSADAAYTSEAHIQDLAARIDTLGLSQVDLVGYSWGALISIGLAARLPRIVRRLVVVDVEPSFDQGESDLFPMPRSFDSPSAAADSLRASNPSAPEELIRLLAHTANRPGPVGTVVPKHDPFFFERWPFRSDDRWDELASLDMPVLLAHAEASFVRCEVMRRMAEAIPRSDLVHLPGTTHVVPVDNPAALLAHLVPFLD